MREKTTVKERAYYNERRLQLIEKNIFTYMRQESCTYRMCIHKYDIKRDISFISTNITLTLVLYETPQDVYLKNIQYNLFFYGMLVVC